MKSHRRELDDLRRSDPDFYKFLQDTDAELLQFQDDEAAEAGASSDSHHEEGGADDEGQLTGAAEVCQAELLKYGITYHRIDLELQQIGCCTLRHPGGHLDIMACGSICQRDIDVQRFSVC